MTDPSASAQRRGRGRPPKFSNKMIAQAVLEIGFPRLTFAAVTERLGIPESTLFRYAPDRDALIRLALDRMFRAVSWPERAGRPWRALLRDYALAAWHAWARHPGAATEAARGLLPAGAMRLIEELCECLVAQGFSPENAVLACDLVFDLVIDNRRGAEHLDDLVADAGPGREGIRRTWLTSDAVGGGEMRERTRVRAALDDAFTARPIDWFSAKLEVVLDGVQHALAP